LAGGSASGTEREDAGIGTMISLMPMGWTSGLSVKGGSTVAKGGGRVFWSGGGNPAVRAAAENFATKNGMTTLEMTRAGQNLTNLTKGMSWAEQAPMWQRLSTQFANGANGTIHVFQNAGGIGMNSVWGTIEYPILQSNGINIIYHIIP
jgi:hypothetical protein